MYDERVAVAALRAAYPDVDSEDPVAFFGEEGTHFQGLMFAWLYWPRLIEIHGAVFLCLNGEDESYIRELLSTPVADGHSDWLPMSWKNVVDNFNWFEVLHLFGLHVPPDEYVVPASEQIAEILVESWSARLKVAYPEREFSVSLMDSDTEDVGIEVVQTAPELEVPAGWDPRRRFINPDV
ncbi:hypothetical protein [Actinopolyspora mortivallis]|uniref:hypothetical protein n=1 Tax=Actinopolyspora mortivallis TaxID=33906 RepID=UPI001FDFC66A|nr:hypothetical protein [Actinopolyspora mortivallis]